MNVQLYPTASTQGDMKNCGHTQHTRLVICLFEMEVVEKRGKAYGINECAEVQEYSVEDHDAC